VASLPLSRVQFFFLFGHWSCCTGYDACCMVHVVCCMLQATEIRETRLSKLIKLNTLRFVARVSVNEQAAQIVICICNRLRSCNTCSCNQLQLQLQLLTLLPPRIWHKNGILIVALSPTYFTSFPSFLHELKQFHLHFILISLALVLGLLLPPVCCTCNTNVMAERFC